MFLSLLCFLVKIDLILFLALSYSLIDFILDVVFVFLLCLAILLHFILLTYDFPMNYVISLCYYHLVVIINFLCC